MDNESKKTVFVLRDTITIKLPIWFIFVFPLVILCGNSYLAYLLGFVVLTHTAQDTATLDPKLSKQTAMAILLVFAMIAAFLIITFYKPEILLPN